MNSDWRIYVLLAIVFWGLWTFVPKISLRTISIQSAFLFEIAGGVFVSLIVLLSTDIQFHTIGTISALAAGFCSYLGIYYYIKAVSLNPVGLTSSISSLYPVVTIVLSILILRENASLKRIVGIVLAILAVYLINLPDRKGRERTAPSVKEETTRVGLPRSCANDPGKKEVD